MNNIVNTSAPIGYLATPPLHALAIMEPALLHAALVEAAPARPTAVESRGRVPVSTYRLQLQRDFTFRDAAALVPYLAELGVSDCYCSPCLQARPGSQHGYDITDHTRL